MLVRHWTIMHMAVAALLGACKEAKDVTLPSAEIRNALAVSGTKLPKTLDSTYLFKDGDPRRPVFGVVPYDVKVPLWSDSAQKSRYVYVPPSKTIGFDEKTGRFVFPTGTVLIKNFASSEGGDHHVETRVIVQKEDGSWDYATYVWKSDGSAENDGWPHTVKGSDGMDYRVPSEKECLGCHENEDGRQPVLGFTPNQLNFVQEDKGNILEYLQEYDFFDVPVETIQKVPALDDPAQEDLSPSRRARAYMEVNCSSCHQPGGIGHKKEPLDYRLGVALEDTGLIEYEKIVPGDPEASVLWKKFTAPVERMPPFSIRQDPVGLEALHDWISSMR